MSKPAVPVGDHLQMLTCQVRMQAFSRAIEQSVSPGDVVIDLGSGLGILSLLALRAGAKRVYAIEKEDSSDVARRVALENGVGDEIVFVKANSLDAHLPEKADLLISETLGSFGVDENCLAFIADARARWLKPGARQIPESLVPWLVPVELPGLERHGEVWKDIAGFDFSGAIAETMEKMGLVSIDDSHMLAAPQALSTIDLQKRHPDALQWNCAFQATRAGVVDGLAGWFELQLCPGVSLSTAPEAELTHWQQALFPVRPQMAVEREETLEALILAGGGGRQDESEITVDLRRA